MQLYCLGTYYQLLNAINIKMNLFPDEEADLLMMDSTDFSQHISVLKELGIFQNLFYVSGAWKKDREYKAASPQEQSRISSRPSEFVGIDFSKKDTRNILWVRRRHFLSSFTMR